MYDLSVKGIELRSLVIKAMTLSFKPPLLAFRAHFDLTSHQIGFVDQSAFNWMGLISITLETIICNKKNLGCAVIRTRGSWGE